MAKKLITRTGVNDKDGQLVAIGTEVTAAMFDKDAFSRLSDLDAFEEVEEAKSAPAKKDEDKK